MRHARSYPAVKLLIRPVTPTGPVPVTTDGQVLSKAQSQSGVGSRLLPPTAAQHAHRATSAILTVRGPEGLYPLLVPARGTPQGEARAF
jgi:hypothetical protein